MKSKQGGVQLILISIGLLLFVLTYLFYPNIKNKNKLSKDQRIVEDIEKITGQTQSTAFEKLEYKGLYDFNKPFKVKSEKAYIFNEEPDIVYMDQMQVILNLSDERIVIITSDKGRYNKRTYDCFFEQNVKATDENTKIYADNLDLLATINSVEIYNNVSLYYTAGNLQADKINYDFETKHFNVSMYDDKAIKMKVIR
jgi:hypothetical protein